MADEKGLADPDEVIGVVRVRDMNAWIEKGDPLLTRRELEVLREEWERPDLARLVKPGGYFPQLLVKSEILKRVLYEYREDAIADEYPKLKELLRLWTHGRSLWARR